MEHMLSQYKNIIEKLHKDVDEASNVWSGSVSEAVFIRRVLESVVKKYGYKLCP